MNIPSLESVLAADGLAVTEPRKLVFTVIKNAATPLTPKQIVSLVSLTDRATVYRTLTTFEEYGVLQKTTIEDTAYYELGDIFMEHHHHMLCTVCQKITVFASKDVEKAIQKVIKRVDFSMKEHSVVLQGICADCK